MKSHYIYRITNLLVNKHYYGVRTSNVSPEKDLGVKYFSSSSDKNFIIEQKNFPERFKYKIVFKFKSRKDAIAMEIKIHNKFNVSLNENFYNKANQTSDGFDTTGRSMFFSAEHKKKLSEVNKGTVPSDSNRIAVSKANKGKTRTENVKKKISETMKRNKIHDIVKIFNSQDELKFECDISFSNFCKEHNLPLTAFVNSHLQNGKRLYQNKTALARAKSAGYEKYQGWYAIKTKNEMS